MSNNTTPPLATVADISGKVWSMAEDGTWHLLQKGDWVHEGEIIVTEAESLVVLRNTTGADLKVTEGKEIALNGGLFESGENSLTLDLKEMIAATDGSPDEGSSGSPIAASVTAQPFSHGSHEQSDSHGFFKVGRIVESVLPPVYKFWSFTNDNNTNSQFRSSNINSLLDGRATMDERIAMPLDPLTFVSLDPLSATVPIRLPAGAPIVYRPLIQQNDVPKNNTTEVTASVQEDALPGGNRDTPDDTTKATGSVAGLVDPGRDVPVTFSLQTTGLNALGLTSKGEPLTYTVSGNTLTASISAGAVFSLTLSGTDNAAFTFTLLAQLDHPAGSGDDANLSLNLSSAILATDNNGDAITVDNGFTIFVENDVPIGDRKSTRLNSSH